MRFFEPKSEKLENDISEMKYYINTVKETLCLNSYSEAKVQLITMAGKIVKSVMVDSNNPSVNLSGIQPGYYLLKIKSANGVDSQLLIIE